MITKDNKVQNHTFRNSLGLIHPESQKVSVPITQIKYLIRIYVSKTKNHYLKSSLNIFTTVAKFEFSNPRCYLRDKKIKSTPNQSISQSRKRQFD